MKKKRINLIEIAALAGVSRSTAGHVLNGKANELHIAESTAEKVMAIAAEHGYLRNRAVRQLHANKTFQIAFITTSEPDEIPTIPPEIVQMMNHFQEKGYQTILINVDVASHEMSPVFQERCFDGMVIFGTVPNQVDIVKWGAKHNIPHVFLHHDTATANNVRIDEQQTADALIKTLFKMGFRRVAFYFPRRLGVNSYFPDDFISSREASLSAAMETYGMAVYPTTVEQRKQNQNQAEFLMRGTDKPPECIITYGLYHAMDFVRYLAEIGLSCPEDAAVLSYTMNSFNSVCRPSICGISYDFEKMGNDLTAMLLQRIESGVNLPNKLTPGRLDINWQGHQLESLDYFKSKERST